MWRKLNVCSYLDRMSNIKPANKSFSLCVNIYIYIYIYLCITVTKILFMKKDTQMNLGLTCCSLSLNVCPPGMWGRVTTWPLSCFEHTAN